LARSYLSQEQSDEGEKKMKQITLTITQQEFEMLQNALFTHIQSISQRAIQEFSKNGETEFGVKLSKAAETYRDLDKSLKRKNSAKVKVA
jgi:LPS O-antigen subunit length determinant protein (WzzB/FepE family)